MFACAYGAAFGAIQQIPQIVPGLPEVRQLTQGLPPPRAGLDHPGDRGERHEGAGDRRTRGPRRARVSRGRHRQPAQADPAVPDPGPDRDAAHLRRRRDDEPRAGCIPAIFLAGFFTVAQFSFWGNYLPRVYPLHLRGTGESFAANIGGRLIGTSFAWLTATLAVTRRPRVRARPRWRSSRPRSASPSTWSASSPASGCPSRRRKICRSKTGPSFESDKRRGLI